MGVEVDAASVPVVALTALVTLVPTTPVAMASESVTSTSKTPSLPDKVRVRRRSRLSDMFLLGKLDMFLPGRFKTLWGGNGTASADFSASNIIL